jgi:hypothetical protein
MATAVIGGLLGGIGSLFGGLFGKSAAEKAAQIQADASLKAAGIQQQEFGQALDFQKGIYGDEKSNLSPYIQTGTADLNNLQALLPSLTTPYQSFQAPTGVDMSNDPGYNFRLQQGEDALNNSAAARGGLLSGGTAKAFEDYAQGFASNEYGNVYNRALQTYGTNASNYYTGQGNQFNRLSALADMGLGAAGTLGAEGTAAGGQIGSTLAQLGNSQAAGVNNAAAASASGIIGGTNALTGGIQGAAGDVSNLLNLQAIMKASRGSGYGATPSVFQNDINDPNNPLNYGQAQPMAKGGPVAAGHAFIVGERGPELFIPHNDGMILPHSRLRAIRDLAKVA